MESDSDSGGTTYPPLPKKKALDPKDKKKKKDKKNDGQVVPLPPINGEEGGNNGGEVDPNKPMVDGLKHFGVGKNGIQRTIVKFQKTPPQFPYSVCFQFPNTFITHRYVLDLVKEKIHFVPGGGITDIQFVDRWVVSLTSIEARDELMRLGIVMFNKKIPLHRYDDVLQEEYKEYQEWQHVQRKIYAKLHGLPCSSDSDDDKDKDKEEEDSDDDTKKKGKKKKKRKAKHKEDEKKEKGKKEDGD